MLRSDFRRFNWMRRMILGVREILVEFSEVSNFRRYASYLQQSSQILGIMIPRLASSSKAKGECLS